LMVVEMMSCISRRAIKCESRDRRSSRARQHDEIVVGVVVLVVLDRS